MTNEQILQELREFKMENNSKLTELSAKFDSLETKLTSLDLKVQKIEKHEAEQDWDIKSIKSELNQLKQEKLKAEIIIKNIPELVEEKNDETVSIVQQVFDKLVIPERIDIKLIRRIGQKIENKNRSILVVLKDPDMKQKILEKKRKVTITAKQILVRGKLIGDVKNIVYIDENLTKMNGGLYRIVREWKREKMIKYAWTKNGTVYVRQDDNSRAISIRDDIDLVNCRNVFKKRTRSLDEDELAIGNNKRFNYITRNIAKTMGAGASQLMEN